MPAKLANHGARIHEAWPVNPNGRKPKSRIARKLARQVGPIRVGARHASNAVVPKRAASAKASTGGSPGVVAVGSATGGSLLLVRSFDIPKDDPLYADLANYSWTYDNALAALAFVADGNRSQARELLDQLAALQNKDGSINFAFDVKTGGSSDVVRSGAVAWVGLAAAAYRSRYGGSSYDPMLAGVVDYLLAQRDESGLIAGGPDVSWVSTQHNLLADELLRELAGQKGLGRYSAEQLAEAEASLSSAIDKQLLVDDGDGVHFREGLADNRIPIDVQALGAMYLETRGDPRAAAVGKFIEQNGWLLSSRLPKDGGKSISGLRPFLDDGSPRVIWTEGTIESQFSLGRLEVSDAAIDAAVKSLAATMTGNNVGPIGADRTSVSSWGEYRTWPTSAAASWLLLVKRSADASLFAK